MAMKVVVLAGSPRKDGNTDLLVSSFVKGAERKGIRAGYDESSELV